MPLFVSKKLLINTARCAYVWVAFTIAVGTANAQDMAFNHIGNNEGLSNSTIQAITQDHRGFIWIGTRDGLNLYDGRQISVFRNIPGRLNSISDNYITCLYTDRANNLWVGTSNGLNRYNAPTRTFTNYTSRSQSAIALHGNQVNCIFEDAQSRIWVGTNIGLNLMNTTDGTFKLVYAASAVNSIYQDKSKNIWLGTDKGLDTYPTQNTPLFKTPISQIQQDDAGNLWLATKSKGLISYNPGTRSTVTYRHNDADAKSLGSDLVLALLADRKGHIWAGTINGGLNIFDPAKNGFKKYTYMAGFNDGLSQRTISALFQDKQGNYWIGTHRGGINIYSPIARKFNVYRQKPAVGGLSYNDVKCFEQDHDGRIWIGTDGGGLNLFDKKRNNFTVYQNRVNDKASLGSDAVLDLTEDDQKRLWIATWGGGLNLLNNTAGSFTRFVNIPGDSTSLSSNYVQNVFQDRKGTLWVGTYFGGLNRFDAGTKKFSRIIKGSGSAFRGNNVVAINEDADDNLWIGTDDGGLNRYNRRNNSFKHYFTAEARMPDIRVIFTDSRKNLWVGHAGLYQYNKKADTFALVTKKAGLDHLFIKGITEDRQGRLWISTSNGLIRYNPVNSQVKTYNTADGLQAMEFEVNAFMKTRDGEMYFGGINGFNTFYPDEIKANPYKPPVYITGFQIFNKDVAIGAAGAPLKSDISITKKVVLNYQQSSISFTFAALNYIAPQNNRYAYQLSGFDKTYVYTPNNKAVYTNLDPGEYTFTVKAANNDGLWNNKGASVIIVITPPWWQTWWFKILAALCAVGAVYAYVVYRHNRQLKVLEEEKKEEIHQTQLQFFTNISHEFRTPLSLILGPLERIMTGSTAQQPDEVEHAHHTIYRNAKRLMHLVSELMDFRKAEAGALKLKVAQGNINLFLDEMAGEFSAWAQQKGITFKVEAAASDQLVFFDRQVLEKILLNLINNALKYTHAGGEVVVSLYFDKSAFTPRYAYELNIESDFTGDRYMFIVVSDTGIGITAESMPNLFQRFYRITSSHLGSGIGLAFVKTLTLLHKGYIKVYSERNKGTDILVALPVSPEDYTVTERWDSGNNEAADIFSNDNYYQYTEETITDSATPVPAKQFNKNILLVDDNIELRNFLKDSLQNSYNIKVANNGQEGLQMVKAHHPDLIISDVMMPVMDGIEFCRQIKQDEHLQHIPFIMLTARNALEAQLEGVGSGADTYLPKPVSINLLTLTINNIFNRQQSLKQRYMGDYEIDAKDAARTEKDKQFIEDLIRIIEDKIADPMLDVQYVCDRLNMSRTKLYELIKQLTGQSIIEFIRTVRLNRARQIMANEDVSIAEVILRVGIQTQAYFTKAFKKEFGKTPSQYLNELSKKQ